jgi:hypothetical protein
MNERSEGDRWFHIIQDRKREHAARVRKANTRARTAAERARDHASQGQHIKMEHTEWTYDEHGNLSRAIYSTGKE